MLPIGGTRTVSRTGTCELGTVYRPPPGKHGRGGASEAPSLCDSPVRSATRWPWAIINGVTVAAVFAFIGTRHTAPMAPARRTRWRHVGCARHQRVDRCVGDLRTQRSPAAHFIRPPRQDVTQARRTQQGPSPVRRPLAPRPARRLDRNRSRGGSISHTRDCAMASGRDGCRAAAGPDGRRRRTTVAGERTADRSRTVRGRAIYQPQSNPPARFGRTTLRIGEGAVVARNASKSTSFRSIAIPGLVPPTSGAHAPRVHVMAVAMPPFGIAL